MSFWDLHSLAVRTATYLEHSHFISQVLHNLRARIETALDESHPHASFVVLTGHAEPTDVPNPRWQRDSHRSGGTALVGGRVVGVVAVRDRLRRPDAKWRLSIGFVPRNTRRMESHC